MAILKYAQAWTIRQAENQTKYIDFCNRLAIPNKPRILLIGLYIFI